MEGKSLNFKKRIGNKNIIKILLTFQFSIKWIQIGSLLNFHAKRQLLIFILKTLKISKTPKKILPLRDSDIGLHENHVKNKRKILNLPRVNLNLSWLCHYFRLRIVILDFLIEQSIQRPLSPSIFISGLAYFSNTS